MYKKSAQHEYNIHRSFHHNQPNEPRFAQNHASEKCDTLFSYLCCLKCYDTPDRNTAEITKR